MSAATGFEAGWLDLREHFDRPAREPASTAFALHALAGRLRVGGAPLQVVDLGCGTGANLRHLAPRLGGSQHWTLIDHDADLLAAVPERLAAWVGVEGGTLAASTSGWRVEFQDWKAEIRLQRLDLAHSLAALSLPPSALVTASALLDLVSRDWALQLIAQARPAAAAFLFALSVDGRIGWQPALADDGLLGRLFGAHQLRDKGLAGPALGPTAAAFFLDRLAAVGWRCTRADSDWLVDARSGAHAIPMLGAMIEGVAAAALEQSPDDAVQVAAWKAERLDCLPRTFLRVGHVDLLCEYAVINQELPGIVREASDKDDGNA